MSMQRGFDKKGSKSGGIEKSRKYRELHEGGLYRVWRGCRGARGVNGRVLWM